MRIFRIIGLFNNKTKKSENKEVDYSIAEMIDFKIYQSGELSEDQINTLRYKSEEQSKLIGLLFQKLYDAKIISDDEIKILLPYNMKVAE